MRPIFSFDEIDKINQLKIKQLIMKMSIAITGVPIVGAPIVVGKSEHNKNITMSVDKVIGPLSKPLEAVLASDDRVEFLRTLKKLPGFSDMASDEARTLWLREHAVDGGSPSSVIGSVEEVAPKLTIHSIGTGAKNVLLRRENVSDASSQMGQPLSLSQALGLVNTSDPINIKKPHTLFLMSKSLSLQSMPVLVTLPPSMTRFIIDTISGTVDAYDGEGKEEDGVRYTPMTTSNVSVKVAYRRGSSKTTTMTQVRAILGKYSLPLPVAAIIADLSPSGLKSLMQKAIRFRAKYVRMPDGKRVRATKVLVETVLQLFERGESFNLNVGQFVYGTTGVSKRLVVIALEDAYFTSEATTKQVFLTGLALAASILKSTFFPSTASILHVVDIAIELLKSPFALDYTAFKGKKVAKVVKFENATSPLDFISATLDILKSFRSDLDMFRFNAQYKLPTIKATSPNRGGTMPLIHCIDHHILPEIVYWMPAKYTIGKFGSNYNRTKPFAQLISSIFRLCTGLNPRRGRPLDETDEFVRAVRVAQYAVWMIKFTKHAASKPYPNEEQDSEAECYTFNHSIDASKWASAMIGHVPIKHNGQKFIAVWTGGESWETLPDVSARGKKTIKVKLEGATKDKIISDLNHTLRNDGFPLRGTTILEVSGIDKKSIVRVDEAGIVLIDDVPWSGELVGRVPTRSRIGECLSLSKALLCRGDSVVTDFKSIVARLVGNQTTSVKRRLLFFLQTFGTVITLPNIGRSGGTSTDGMVMFDDLAVLNLLRNLAILVPGALRLVPGNVRSFSVPNALLLWHVRDFIKSTINSHVEEVKEEDDDGWRISSDTMRR